MNLRDVAAYVAAVGMTAAVVVTAGASPAPADRAGGRVPVGPQSPARVTSGPGAVTSARLDDVTYGQYATARTDLAWSVPDTWTAGDRMAVALPSVLDATSIVPFELIAEDGSVAADVVVEDGTLVATFTEYIDRHTDVSGTAHFTTRFDQSELMFTDGVMVLDVYPGQTVTIEQHVGGPVRPENAYAWWVGGQGVATALRPDGALVDPDGPHAVWGVNLRAGAWTESVTEVTLDDDLELCEDGELLFPGGRLLARGLGTGAEWGSRAVPAQVEVSATCAGRVPTFVVTAPRGVLDGLQLRLDFPVRHRTNASGEPVHGRDDTVGFKDGYTAAATTTVDGAEIVTSDVDDLVYQRPEGSASATPVTAHAREVSAYHKAPA
ncbi:Ig-like domain-containing protein [Georgenia alba]|uniref:Ig-like domain-containing protein n=1 Tax=Georgenia alba TaxID=2233858 RepID=A0ABW2Q5Q2_9MICO